jgi:hypothetical protein
MSTNNNQVFLGNVGPIANLSTFCIRNGNTADCTSLISKAAIGDSYKWVPVAGMPTNLAMSHVAMYIKSALANFMEHPVTGWTEAQRRKASIILGTARAVMTTYYSLADEDFIAGEMALPYLRYNVSTTASTATTPTVSYTIETRATAAMRTMFISTTDFDNDERSFMSDLVLCSVGIPAVQGASLISCQHHYLSEARDGSRKMYDVIEKQFWKSEPTRGWMAADKALFQDILWHKAGHPISITLKTNLAMDPDVAERIVLAGAGSAASRLPAVESQLRAANTAATLLGNVQVFYEMSGGVMNYDLLKVAIEAVEKYRPGRTRMTAVMGSAVIHHHWVPMSVVSRATAIKWLGTIMDANMGHIAMAFGFYKAMVEQTSSGVGGENEKTLLGAHSLAKLESNFFAPYQLGRESYLDYKAHMKANRDKAKYRAGVIVFSSGEADATTTGQGSGAVGGV